jgi:hypothetical protein
MTADFRALCAELLEIVEGEYEGSGCYAELCQSVRAALAQPEPEGAGDEELLRCYGLAKRDHCYEGSIDDWPKRAERAATVHGLRAVLARWGRPTIEPVPVAERLPGPKDCDADGRCWLCGKVQGDWRLLNPANSGVPQLKYCFSHWLPHWALPVPQQEVG